MIPDNEASSTPVISGFSFPVKSSLQEDKFQDWELGGIALNDASEGLLHQLWHFTLEIDPDTGEGSVYVEAPEVAKTLLFFGMDISEIAGCFDQNMNPFVAYTQGGLPKIYWYDSTVPGQIHTTLASGAIDLRCSLDEKRFYGVAESDIILSYIRDGELIITYQRDRYEVEYVLAENVERLISMAMNKGSRMQWRATGQSAEGYTDPYLGDVVYDLCRMAGIRPENIDVSDLYKPTDRVPGIKIDVDDGFDKPIEWLMEIYLFTKSQHNKKLVFRHLGQPVVMRIPYAHLVVNGNERPLRQTKVDAKRLPKMVNVSHIDSTGGFAKNKQSASRRTNTVFSDAVLNIESRVVLTPDLAATAALTILKARHGEQYAYKFSTTIKYTELVPSDVIEVEDEKGFWHRIRIEEKNEDDRVIDWEGVQDAGDLVYGASDALGKALDIPISTTPGTIGDTILEILNLPVQRDQDDELGLYLAAKGEGTGWSGYALYFSVDGGISYSQMFTSEVASNIGETATSITDVGSSVEVLVPYPLESVNSTQLAAGFNRAVIGDEEIQFLTATLLGMVGDLYHYNLTGIVKGVLHTTKEPWAAGTRFVFIDTSVIFARIQREFFGVDLYYKAVSLGQSLDDATPLVYLFDPALSQTEWPVTDVEVTAASGGGITVTWDGSERLGTFGPTPYHSKYLVGYQVKFADGHIIETTAETVTYPAGLMGTVVEVRARNDITGLGPLADGEGSVDPGDTPVFGFSGSFPDMYEGQSVFLWNGDNGIDMSGGFWDANARGFVVPGVGAKCSGSTLDGTTFCGIPFAAGTYTSKVRMDASSPDPLGSGSSDVSQTVEVLTTPSHGLLDLRFREYQMFKTTLINTTPPWKKFQINGGGTSIWFNGVTTGKVVGQFIIDGAAALSVLIGINNLYGEMGLGGPTTAGVGEFSDCAVLVGDGTYSMELDADTGDWYLYKDVAGTPTLVDSGNVTITGDHQYRICLSNEQDQVFTAEFNAGSETWFMTITQAGHAGIPLPSRDIPAAWAYCEPDYILSFNGSGEVGAIYADDFAGGPSSFVTSNAEYSTGRHRFQVAGAYSSGICVSGFDITDGALGSAGSPDSAGMTGNVLKWCFGGVDNSATLTPLNGTYLYPILALDADGNTLKVCYQDHYGVPTVVYTLSIPSGVTWRIGAWVTNGTYLNSKLTGPAGYADAIVV